MSRQVLAGRPHWVKYMMLFLLVAFLVIATIDAFYYTSTWVIATYCATLGALYGGVHAINDIRLVAHNDFLEIRNPILIHEIPWSLIKDAQVAQGLRLTIRGRRTRVAVTAASDLVRFNRGRPTQVQLEIYARTRGLARANTDNDPAVARIYFKTSWLTALLFSTASFILYGLLLHAIR